MKVSIDKNKIHNALHSKSAITGSMIGGIADLGIQHDALPIIGDGQTEYNIPLSLGLNTLGLGLGIMANSKKVKI